MAIECYYKSITKYDNVKVSDGRGGYIHNWVEVSVFQGLINQASSKEQEQANKLGVIADYKLYCPVDVMLNIDDIIGFNNEYYRVVSKPKNTIQRNHHFKILLKNISLDQETF